MNVHSLGGMGLAFRHAGVEIRVDPPVPSDVPAVITWSEPERTAGIGGPVAADERLLRRLGVPGTALGGTIPFGGAMVTARPYTPIPYATPAEFARKSMAALRRPWRLGRLAWTVRRPGDPPYVLRIRVGEGSGAGTAVYLHQALHRFQDVGEILAFAEGADLVVAGTDYDDEEATAAAFHRLEAPDLVLVDLVGPVRRRLGLPVRPMAYTLARCPPRTRLI